MIDYGIVEPIGNIYNARLFLECDNCIVEVNMKDVKDVELIENYGENMKMSVNFPKHFGKLNIFNKSEEFDVNKEINSSEELDVFLEQFTKE